MTASILNQNQIPLKQTPHRFQGPRRQNSSTAKFRQFIHMLKDYDRGFKIIIAGSQGVGKSSLLLRFVDNCWAGNLQSTIGVDFKFKTITLNGSKVKMQIWDTAGSETFKSIVSAYYRGADAVVLVYDRSDSVSFAQLKNFWVEEVKKYKEPTCELMLIANKSDLGSGGISEEEIKNLMKAQDITIYKEVSAKTGEQVSKAFQQLALKLMKKGPKSKAKNNQILRMSIESHNEEANKKCCGGSG